MFNTNFANKMPGTESYVVSNTNANEAVTILETDAYVQVSCDAIANNASLVIINNTNGMRTRLLSPGSNTAMYTYLPARKGHRVSTICANASGLLMRIYPTQ